MARVVFKHSRSDTSAVHIFRNFGEDVWREFRDDKRIRVSLEEIDRATDSFAIETKPALGPRVLQRAKPILRRHLIEETCTVTVEACR